MEGTRSSGLSNSDVESAVLELALTGEDGSGGKVCTSAAPKNPCGCEIGIMFCVWSAATVWDGGSGGSSCGAATSADAVKCTGDASRRPVEEMVGEDDRDHSALLLLARLIDGDGSNNGVLVLRVARGCGECGDDKLVSNTLLSVRFKESPMTLFDEPPLRRSTTIFFAGTKGNMILQSSTTCKENSANGT